MWIAPQTPPGDSPITAMTLRRVARASVDSPTASVGVARAAPLSTFASVGLARAPQISIFASVGVPKEALRASMDPSPRSEGPRRPAVGVPSRDDGLRRCADCPCSSPLRPPRYDIGVDHQTLEGSRHADSPPRCTDGPNSWHPSPQSEHRRPPRSGRRRQSSRRRRQSLRRRRQSSHRARKTLSVAPLLAFRWRQSLFGRSLSPCGPPRSPRISPRSSFRAPRPLHDGQRMPGSPHATVHPHNHGL